MCLVYIIHAYPVLVISQLKLTLLLVRPFVNQSTSVLWILKVSQVHFSAGVPSEVVSVQEELEAAVLGTYSTIFHFKLLFAMLHVNPYFSIASVMCYNAAVGDRVFDGYHSIIVH